MSDLQNCLTDQPLADWRWLIDGFSLEVPVGKIAAFNTDPMVLPPGSLVFLPHLRGAGAGEMGAACRRLVARGYGPVPHVAARHFESAQAFAAFLAAAAAGGARHLLVLGGDRENSAGPYSSALDLITSPRFADFAFDQVMIAGYIECHPRIGQPVLALALRQKLQALEKLGRKVAIISQFGFDAGAYVAWVKGLREAGVAAPLRLGVAGVTSLPMLAKYAVMCGIGPSLSLLRTRAGAIANLLGGYTPQGLIQEVAAGINAQGLDDVSLHIFPFGGAIKTLDWIKAARRADANQAR